MNKSILRMKYRNKRHRNRFRVDSKKYIEAGTEHIYKSELVYRKQMARIARRLTGTEIMARLPERQFYMVKSEMRNSNGCSRIFRGRGFSSCRRRRHTDVSGGCSRAAIKLYHVSVCIAACYVLLASHTRNKRPRR